MVHVIDAASYRMLASVLVDARAAQRAVHARRQVDLGIVRAARHGLGSSTSRPAKITGKVAFACRALRARNIQAVGLVLTRDGTRAFVALGPANRVAEIDTRTLKVAALLSGRPARLAARALVGREAALHRQRKFRRRLGDRISRPARWSSRSASAAAPGPGGRAMTGAFPSENATGAFSGKVASGFPSENATRKNEPALALAHLSHSFSGRRALDDVSFSVGRGRLHGPARPQRRRQDHADFAGHRALPCAWRLGPRVRTRVCANSRCRALRPDGAWCFSS